MAKLYQTAELPDREVMNDLITAVRSGLMGHKVDLTPGPESGWYDYKVYALETLILPGRAQEADKLFLHADYKRRSRKAFEGLLTQRRETHIKQLFQPMTRSKPVRLSPRLALEPAATHYLRTARAYRFLGETLKSSFMPGELAAAKLGDHDSTLMKELESATALFYGLYLAVCSDLGMVPAMDKNEIVDLGYVYENDDLDTKGCSAAECDDLTGEQRDAWAGVYGKAADWLANFDSQEFMDEDIRVTVPVLSNLKGTRVRNWAVLGTRLMKLKAYYARRPEVVFTGAERDISIDWRPKCYVIPVQVFAEVTLEPKPLTREEFRDICDQHRTKAEITKALDVSSR